MPIIIKSKKSPDKELEIKIGKDTLHIKEGGLYCTKGPFGNLKQCVFVDNNLQPTKLYNAKGLI